MAGNMIYLDNAATTLIKPPGIYRAVQNAMLNAANSGRSGHKPSLYASQIVYKCRCSLAELFGIAEKPERIVFTQNATHALNIAIKSILHNGGRAVVSSYEHNSVMRPLDKLRENGVTADIARCPLFDPEAAVSSFKKCIDEQKTDCVIVNHVSNVFGYELPIRRIDDICSKRNIPLVIDASQSAGVEEIKVKDLKSAAYICMPGHKSLFGPQGTGVLICCNDKYLYSITEGGTGSNSHDKRQPDFLPDVFESGTLNIPGISGLYAGVEFVKKYGIKEISRKHRELTYAAVVRLRDIAGINVFSGPWHEHGVVSFCSDTIGCEEIGESLNESNIFVRCGYHCAPEAHRSAGTNDKGTVRISFSVFNSVRDIDILCRILNKTLSKKTSVFY